MKLWTYLELPKISIFIIFIMLHGYGLQLTDRLGVQEKIADS